MVLFHNEHIYVFCFVFDEGVQQNDRKEIVRKNYKMIPHILKTNAPKCGPLSICRQLHIIIFNEYFLSYGVSGWDVLWKGQFLVF